MSRASNAQPTRATHPPAAAQVYTQIQHAARSPGRNAAGTLKLAQGITSTTVQHPAAVPAATLMEPCLLPGACILRGGGGGGSIFPGLFSAGGVALLAQYYALIPLLVVAGPSGAQAFPNICRTLPTPPPPRLKGTLVPMK